MQKKKRGGRNARFGFSLIEKNKALQKNSMKVGVKKLLRAGMMASKDVESACSRDGSHGKV